MEYPAPLTPPGWRAERIAVIGSGIAGCLAARELALEGYEVQVIEERSQAFSGTSATALQAHLGGLYSGNPETARQCLASAIEVKKALPYALNGRRASFLVAEESELSMDDYVAFYEGLAGYYGDLPAEDRVFGPPDKFFRVVPAEDCGFAKNIVGGIETQEPGLDMDQAKRNLLGELASLQVSVEVGAEVVEADRGQDDDFLLLINRDGAMSESRFDQVVNAGGYKCRLLDHMLGDRTGYNLSLEAKCIVRDLTPGESMPPFYVVKGNFMHVTQIGNDGLACINTARPDGGYIDTAVYDEESYHLPEEWHYVMSTGNIPDMPARQRTILEFANDTFLAGRHLEPVKLIPGISTSFSVSRCNRSQKDATVITAGWQTIVPTKATHALKLARQAAANAISHSAR